MEGSSFVCFLLFVFTVFLEAEAGRVARDDTGSMLKVTTILQEPYVMHKDGSRDFEGFIPDLLEAISDIAKFSYDLSQVHGNMYGNRESGHWTGLMGEIVNRRANIAAAPMTKSPERESYVDFTEQFMDAYLTILIKKPEEGEDPPIDSASDLLHTDAISYGCIRGGSTHKFFEMSRDAPYRQMFQHMQDNPTSIVETTEEGVRKVQSSGGSYAFIMESPTAEYYVNNGDCDLMTVDNFHPVEYALAVQQGSDVKDDLNNALDQLKRNGKIKELKEKWWKGKCNPDSNGAQKTTTSSLLVLTFFTLFYYI